MDEEITERVGIPEVVPEERKQSIRKALFSYKPTETILPTVPKHPELSQKPTAKARGVNTCARINALLHSSSVVLVTHMNGGQQIVKEVQSHNADWKKVTLLCEDGIERVIYSPWFTPLGELFLGLP